MRKEDIINAGIEYTLSKHPICVGGAKFEKEMREFNRNEHFEAGAEYAIEKVIQETINFFKEEMYEGLDDWNDRVVISSRFNNMEEFINYYKSKIRE